MCLSGAVIPIIPPRGSPPPRRSSREGIPVGRRWRGGVVALREGIVPGGAGRAWAEGVRRAKDGMVSGDVEYNSRR